MITEQMFERAHKILDPCSSKSVKVKQELLRMLIKSGRFEDDTLPLNFFHRSMTKLEISGSKISIVFIKKLSSICTELQTLNLSGSFRLTDDAIEMLLMNCKDMKELHLENCRKLTDQTLMHFIKLCPKLMCLDVGGNYNMTLTGLSKCIEQHVNHSKFTKVHISGHVITDELLHLIESKCRKLHSLCIGYSSVSDDALISLLDRRKLINRLHIHWNTAVTDRILYHMATNCPNLQEINLCGTKTFTVDALRHFIYEKMQIQPDDSTVPPRKKLKKIDLKYSSILTKETQSYVSTTYPELTLQV